MFFLQFWNFTLSLNCPLFSMNARGRAPGVVAPPRCEGFTIDFASMSVVLGFAGLAATTGTTVSFSESPVPTPRGPKEFSDSALIASESELTEEPVRCQGANAT